jgi:hypothetical protein
VAEPAGADDRTQKNPGAFASGFARFRSSRLLAAGVVDSKVGTLPGLAGPD